MSTWRLLPDERNGYRWELEGNRAAVAQVQQHDSTARLPSMSDLLLKGCPKLQDGNANPNLGSSPMFCTGLGKSVALKQSSIAKALAVLGDDDLLDSGQLHLIHHRPRTSSLFQTGSGKMLNVSSASLMKGETLLRLEEDGNNYSSHGPKLARGLASGMDMYINQDASKLRGQSTEIADLVDTPSVSSYSLTFNTALVERSSIKGLDDASTNERKVHDMPMKPASIKFQTAGGKSISISNEALKRARSLLGDAESGNLLDEDDPDGKSCAFVNGRRFCDNSSKKENESPLFRAAQANPHKKDVFPSFISPLQGSSSNQMPHLNMSEKITGGSNLISEFDAAARENDCRSNIDFAYMQKPLTGISPVPGDSSILGGTNSRSTIYTRPSNGPLVDISNRNGANLPDNEKNIRDKRMFGRTSSISPFKRPRSSKFSTPLKRNSSLLHTGLSVLPMHSPSKGRVCTRYPSLVRKASMTEYFGGPPRDKIMSFPRGEQIKSDNADKFIFSDEAGSYSVGTEALFHMLIQSGASAQHVSRRWVSNHYRWIVWKLAHYEQCYPSKCAGKWLTISNVLEELKYRYEREVNHAHRSAIKRILEGDASPSSMLVLCVSAINSNCEPHNEHSSMLLDGRAKNNLAKVELTDGWYSMGAVFDELLSKYCESGKIFVGQKLRIWGARLSGWAGPTSPLEATDTVNLLLHVNGTYRANWADKLGFCKGPGAPLAFRCIKSSGGPIPRTLVGVTRIYPILYKERSSSGGPIVRSEKMEMEIRQIYSERCSAVVEGVISQFHRGSKDFCHLYNESDSEEGAKISKLLETAAEPEVLMAEMSPDQLNAFATYQSKVEAIRQSDIRKSIEKALQDAGLSERDVTPFVRLKVVGLRSKNCTRENGPEEGFITIWNPTEMQLHDLVEGQAYVISGLLPVSGSDTIYLQASGSTTKWKPLTPKEVKNFRTFFTPRKAISLSKLGEVPLSSEFDIAGLILYVGEASASANPRQRKQWIFVTDASTAESHAGELSTSLLAISFCSSYMDDMSSVPFNSNLVGSTVGFCNLIKRAKDQGNNLWVADATENSTYFLKFDGPCCSHLKSAAVSIQGWANISELVVINMKYVVEARGGFWLSKVPSLYSKFKRGAKAHASQLHSMMIHYDRPIHSFMRQWLMCALIYA